jgi:hypothetical protein
MELLKKAIETVVIAAPAALVITGLIKVIGTLQLRYLRSKYKNVASQPIPRYARVK